MNKKVTTALLSLAISLGITSQASAYTINDEFNLGVNEGSSQVAVPNKIILHETANPRATARNEATYMKRNWRNAYTTDIIGDGGIVYRVGEQGFVSWGAGNANPYAPVQIELQHTKDKTLFEKNYRAYIDYTRDSAKKFNIPLTLDQGTSLLSKGIVSHKWVSDYVWGDHQDPYGYLAEMGVSKTKLAHDLANGFGSDNQTTSPNKPTVDPTRAGSANPTLVDGSNAMHLDQFGEIERNNLHVAGWHKANYKYQYVFIMDYNTGKELSRVKASGIYRPDVNSAYNTQGNLGYHVSFNMKNFPNKKVYVMSRATNDPSGNTKGGSQDFHDKRWYLTIPKR